MTPDELKVIVAEMRESYGKVFKSVLTEMIDRYGCTGIKNDLLYSFPIFGKHPSPADIDRLACAYSDMAHLSSDTLSICTFFAPSGRNISITQSIMT